MTTHATSHNVQTVRSAQHHYRQCFVPATETLFDKLCGAAAILLLVAALPLVMVLG